MYQNSVLHLSNEDPLIFVLQLIEGRITILHDVLEMYLIESRPR